MEPYYVDRQPMSRQRSRSRGVSANSDVEAITAPAPDATAVAFDAALKSPLGLVLYVPAEESVPEQEAQCWELLYIVQRLIEDRVRQHVFIE